jgi:hypothetical protein
MTPDMVRTFPRADPVFLYAPRSSKGLREGIDDRTGYTFKHGVF